MHRPRGRAAVLTSAPPPEDPLRQAPLPQAPLPQAPLPQAWVPRVVNLALAVVLGLLVAPLATNFGGKPAYVQVALLMVAVPVLLLVAACLASALRPGSLGRALRRRRRR